MSLRQRLADYWCALQTELFPALEDATGPLPERYQVFVTVLEFVRVERFLPRCGGLPGRPQQDRVALARAFIAKAVFDLSSTRTLIERLTIDRTLRRLCGWTRAGEVPSESTFSRAFGAFAASALPSRLHEALIGATLQDHLVGHLSRDSTAIPARERPKRKRKPAKPAEPKYKRGRPRKGEQRPRKPPRRLQRQQHMSLPQMLDDLPQDCDVGTKRNSKGYKESWIGYKLHLDVADGGIPVSCILTSASVHDSQVAIPLAAMSSTRVTNLYDLMDSAYDAAEISAQSLALGHVAIIDPNPRRCEARKQALNTEAEAQRAAGYVYPDVLRFRERTTVERANGRLKDEFGGRQLRVRGHAKVLCHLMFGILALSVDQLVRMLH